MQIAKISTIEDDVQFSQKLSFLFGQIRAVSSKPLLIPYSQVSITMDGLPFINRNFENIGQSLGIELTKLTSLDNAKNLIQTNMNKIYEVI